MRTDRRPNLEEGLYSRPESRQTQDADGEESKETTLSTGYNQSKYIPPAAGNTQPNTNSLRDSHESMRSIQKQRIQRSLQKS